jgi:hypothetical protein
MYSSSMNATGHDDLDGPWWADVERLLVAHQVDLCLWGHVHNVRCLSSPQAMRALAIAGGRALLQPVRNMCRRPK